MRAAEVDVFGLLSSQPLERPWASQKERYHWLGAVALEVARELWLRAVTLGRLGSRCSDFGNHDARLANMFPGPAVARPAL
jgi:hypothetical protein